jgi:hypothetical protein
VSEAGEVEELRAELAVRDVVIAAASNRQRRRVVR